MVCYHLKKLSLKTFKTSPELTKKSKNKLNFIRTSLIIKRFQSLQNKSKDLLKCRQKIKNQETMIKLKANKNYRKKLPQVRIKCNLQLETI